jgi:hypothetical protein
VVAAGVDIALVSKLLGLATLAITAGTYSHQLEGVCRKPPSVPPRWYQGHPAAPRATNR